jgi:DNA invertase Pin-like site-specific DNA recombinase
MTQGKGQTVGYIRVSSVDQSTARQLEGIELDRTYTDKASGKDTNRPQLKEAMGYCRGGDVLVVHSIDRLARNVEDMLRIVRELTTRGVSVRFVKENMLFDGTQKDPRSNFLFTIFSAVSEFERELIKERQLEGIALAKKRGVYKGRSPKLTTAQKEEARTMAAQGQKKTDIGRKLGVSRDTIYRALAEETA